MRYLAVAMLAAIPACAQYQFNDPATNRDGSLLYFASPLSLRGTDPLSVSKVFSITDGRIEMKSAAVCRELVPESGPAAPPDHLFPCDAVSPQLSGDGSIFAWTSVDKGLEVTRLNLPGVVFDGRVRMSPNGRYLLRYSAEGAPDFIDLSSGAATPLPGMTVVGDARQAVANDGTVVLETLDGIVLRRPDRTVQRIPALDGSSLVRINAAGTRLAWETSVGIYQAGSYDLATGAKTVLANGPDALQFPHSEPIRTWYFDPLINDDGSWVLVNSNTQPHGGPKDLWFIRWDALDRRRISRGVNPQTIALSGDGLVSFAAGNRIVRINTTTGETVELVPDTAWIQGDSGEYTPGGYVILSGTGLQGAVTVNGTPGYIIGANGHEMHFKMPWETPVGEDVIIDIPGKSPFATAIKRPTVPFAGHSWFPYPIHQDFSGFVWEQSPSHAGEYLHLYLTGLGLVSPLVPLDQPAPASPLSHTVNRVTCILTIQSRALEAPVLFAGLAPGTIWVYQVDLQVPAAAQRGEGTLNCNGAEMPVSVR